MPRVSSGLMPIRDPHPCSMNSAPQLAFAQLAKPVFYKQRDNQLFPPWAYSLTQVCVVCVALLCWGTAEWGCLLQPGRGTLSAAAAAAPALPLRAHFRRSSRNSHFHFLHSSCCPCCPRPKSPSKPIMQQVITQMPQSTVEAIVFSVVVYWVRLSGWLSVWLAGWVSGMLMVAVGG